MPDCSRIDALVTPFVDGELPESETRAVAGHLSACPLCRAKVAAEESIRSLMQQRRRELCACAPSALKSRCAKLAASTTADAHGPRVVQMPQRVQRPALSAWRSRLMPLGIAAALFLIVGTLVYQATSSSSKVLAAELTAHHEKCFRMNKLLGTHDTAEGVERSMASYFGWHMQMPDLDDHQDISVVGSRPCLYGEGTTAHIMFRRNGEPVSLFMLRGTPRTSEVVEVFGHQCRIWSEGERTFVLVARSSTVPLDEVAAVVRTSIK